METIKNKTLEEIKELLKDNFNIKEDKNFPDLYLITAKRPAKDEKAPVIDKKWDIFHRGIILEKGTNKPIFVSFTDREEFDETKPELSNYGLDWNACQIEESVEGSQIKLYHYQGAWRVATSHCIDAHRSNWDGNNFYDLFVEAAAYEKFDFENMDPKYCHLLVIQHPKNVLVTEFANPKLIHILSRDLSREDIPEVELDLGLPKPNIVSKFKNIEELLLVLRENKVIDKEGYIIRDKATNKRIKILSKSYQEAAELRMNISSNNTVYHYLMLRAKDKVYDYIQLYMKYGPIFREIEMKLDDMITEILQQYLRKFKFKEIKMSDVFYQFRPIIFELNGTYLATRIPLTRNDVKNALYKKVPEQIAFMYNLYYNGVRVMRSDSSPLETRREFVRRRRVLDTVPSLDNSCADTSQNTEAVNASNMASVSEDTDEVLMQGIVK